MSEQTEQIQQPDAELTTVTGEAEELSAKYGVEFDLQEFMQQFRDPSQHPEFHRGAGTVAEAIIAQLGTGLLSKAIVWGDTTADLVEYAVLHSAVRHKWALLMAAYIERLFDENAPEPSEEPRLKAMDQAVSTAERLLGEQHETADDVLAETMERPSGLPRIDRDKLLRLVVEDLHDKREAVARWQG